MACPNCGDLRERSSLVKGCPTCGSKRYFGFWYLFPFERGLFRVWALQRVNRLLVIAVLLALGAFVILEKAPLSRLFFLVSISSGQGQPTPSSPMPAHTSTTTPASDGAAFVPTDSPTNTPPTLSITPTTPTPATPTLSLTPSPSPTVTLTPTLSEEEKPTATILAVTAEAAKRINLIQANAGECVVKAAEWSDQNVILRSESMTASGEAGTLEKDAQLPVTGWAERTYNDDPALSVWWRTEYEGNEAWANSRYTSISGDCTNLPHVSSDGSAVKGLTPDIQNTLRLNIPIPGMIRFSLQGTQGMEIIVGEILEPYIITLHRNPLFEYEWATMESELEPAVLEAIKKFIFDKGVQIPHASRENYRFILPETDGYTLTIYFTGAKTEERTGNSVGLEDTLFNIQLKR